MKKHFCNAKAYLTPDIVMTLKETEDKLRNGVVLMFRRDKEKTKTERRHAHKTPNCFSIYSDDDGPQGGHRMGAPIEAPMQREEKQWWKRQRRGAAVANDARRGRRRSSSSSSSSSSGSRSSRNNNRSSLERHSRLHQHQKGRHLYSITRDRKHERMRGRM